MAAPRRNRAFCFTINHYEPAWREEIKCLFEAMNVTYFIMGYEVGEKGTPHIQGYVYFKSPRAMTSVIKMLAKYNNARIAIAGGTAAENQVYCSKAEDFIEMGEIPQQGSRTDLDTIRERILGGETVKELVRAISR